MNKENCALKLVDEIIQYISFLATCFGSYKTIVRQVLSIWRCIQYVHTLCDGVVKSVKVKVNPSRYRPGVAQSVPGS